MSRHQKTVQELAADMIWIYEHWEELCKTHPGKAIGVHDGKIVASAESHGHLDLELKALGLRPAEVARQYINADPTFVKSFVALRPARVAGLRNGDIAP